MNNIEKMQAARAQKAAEGSIKIFTNPIDKWLASNRKSRSLAIAANCAECMGCAPGIIEPGFKQSIKECTMPTCSLHGFRPYK